MLAHLSCIRCGGFNENIMEHLVFGRKKCDSMIFKNFTKDKRSQTNIVKDSTGKSAQLSLKTHDKNEALGRQVMRKITEIRKLVLEDR